MLRNRKAFVVFLAVLLAGCGAMRQAAVVAHDGTETKPLGAPLGVGASILPEVSFGTQTGAAQVLSLVSGSAHVIAYERGRLWLGSAFVAIPGEAQWGYVSAINLQTGKIAWQVKTDQPMIGGATEFDDRPGPVRDALVAMVKAWHAALHKAIQLSVQEGHLQADADVDQIVFELHGLILSLHHDARFMRIPGALARAGIGFDRAVQFYATPAGLELERSRKAPKTGATKR